MNKNQQRRGYTLIELLVVIALIALLAALTLTFLPNFASSQTESRAAMNVQTWLNMAKQKALRDQATRGVRFNVTSDTFGGPTTLNNICKDAQFLEQPEDFSGGQIGSALPIPPPPPASGYNIQNCLFLANSDPTNGYGATIPNGSDANRIYWNVQPNDYLEIRGTGLMYRIIQVGVPNSTGTVQSSFIVVTPPLTYPVTATAQYRIVRAPRPVGEDLKMPEGTIIDFGTNLYYLGQGVPEAATPPIDTATTANGTGFVDILFSQSGAVISPGVTNGKIHLWIRAPYPGDENNFYRGDPSIISVFVKTGLVGAFSPDRGPNPYVLVY